MVGLGSLFTIVGIGVAELLAEEVLKATGHGDKIIFVKVIGFVAAGVFALNIWFEGVNYVKMMFNVHF